MGKATNQVEDIVNHEYIVRHNHETEKLKQIFELADVDGSGGLCKLEFRQLFRNEQVTRWLQELDLEIHEVSSFFQLIDNGDGLVTFDEFISGVLRFRGHARAVDTATLLHENKRIRNILRKLGA